MSTQRGQARGAARHYPEGQRPDRAVIDIGSNTVRLVVYAGSQRAPEVWLNEKVSARLGRDLATTGVMPRKAMDLALSALARFAAILPDLGVTDVQTVATAAVRDATNGGDFLDRVRLLGLDPVLLSGEEEARASAFGVIGAFPGAQGTVADLGGGSLELVMVENGDCHDGVSLPLGTLRLPALRALGAEGFDSAVRQEMRRAGWAAAHPGPLYMVGGTWRTLAIFYLRRGNGPLSDPHALRLTVEEADALARRVAQVDVAELAQIQGIAGSRAPSLADAAAMLQVMLAELQPDGVVFSSWGLREGLLFQRQSPLQRQQDPLLAAVGHFTGPRGGSPRLAAMIAAWTAEVANGRGDGSERLRMAATMLALAAAQVEPNLRQGHAWDWAMGKRWLSLSPSGRARLAAALLGSVGKTNIPSALLTLASEADLREAMGWGLAIRLCRRMGAGTPLSLLGSALRREGDRLVLCVEKERAPLVTDIVTGDLKTLAGWMGLTHELVIGPIRSPAMGAERAADPVGA
jgi:exopolyphosphatase/guanosine-5'-triphosphate,3'-diphosphate pyrophosphatase